jgi:hypothetical protein
LRCYVLAVGGRGQQQAGDGFRDWCRWVAQAEQDVGAVADDVVDSEPDDSADGLGVEQHETRGDPQA